MPLAHKLKFNNCNISIWKTTESLDALKKKSDISNIASFKSEKRKKEVLFYADNNIKKEDYCFIWWEDDWVISKHKEIITDLQYFINNDEIKFYTLYKICLLINTL